MDVVEIVRVLARRWYIVVLGLALAVAGAWSLSQSAPVEYEAQTSFAVIEIPQARVAVTSTVLAELVQDANVRGRIRDNGPTAYYEVVAEPETGLLRIVATSPDGQDAVRTVNQVLNALDRELQTRQEDQAAAEIRDASIQVLNRAGFPQEIPGEQDAPSTFRAVGTAQLVGVEEASSQLGRDDVRALLVDRLEGGAVLESIEQQLGEDFVYEVEIQEDGPGMSITSTGPGEQGVLTMARLVVDEAAAQMADIQETIGTGQPRYDLQRVVEPYLSEVNDRGSLRVLVAVLGLGLVATAALAVGLDTFLRRRSDSAGQPPTSGRPHDRDQPEQRDEEPSARFTATRG